MAAVIEAGERISSVNIEGLVRFFLKQLVDDGITAFSIGVQDVLSP